MTAGTICTIAFVPLLFLIVLGVTIAAWLTDSDIYDFEEIWMLRIVRIGGIFACLGIIGGTIWGMWPFDAEYHEWREHQGTVASVDSRLIAATDSAGSETKYVVRFEDSPQQYGVTDTRMAGVKTGQHLTITCVRQFQYAGTDGYDCNFVEVK